MSRLERIAPNLAKKLQELDVVKLKELKLAACKYVLPLVSSLDPFVIEAMSELSENGKLSEENRSRLDCIADPIDEQYYRLYQTCPDDENALRCFSQVRALNAMSMAGLEDPYTSAVESIYEALQSSNDREVLVKHLELLAGLRGNEF